MSSRIEETGMLPTRVVLIACGSFSPPTPMHFRMFEIARDHFNILGTHSVIGGVVSPTHDSYGKKGLAEGKHRFTMVKLALQSSKWIRVSDWEVEQLKWSRTQQVLQYHQNYMNNYINSPSNDESIIPGWLPHGLRDRRDKVQLKLLCGADLLESFAVPGLWADADIEDIVSNHGLVVISRSGANPEKFIFDSDILTKYQKNITLVTNWVPNEVSSSMIRRLLRRGQSVKYLIDDLVLEYIKINGLFDYKAEYLTHHDTNHAVYNDAYINHVNISFLDSTPSSSNIEEMDETDNNSLKKIFTSIELDNSHPRIFCCGNSESVGTKLINRLPGQAVKVITNSPLKACEQDEIKAKRMKKSSAHML